MTKRLVDLTPHLKREPWEQNEDQVMDFSNQIVALKDYVVLNTKAFAKILKKHDKVYFGNELKLTLVKKLEWNTQKDFLEKVFKKYFYTSNVLDEIESQIHKTMMEPIKKKIEQQQDQTIEKAPTPVVINDFRIKDLEKGKIHHIWVPLVQNAFALPISVPVLVARGKKRGPLFGITCALHGKRVFHEWDDHH